MTLYTAREAPPVGPAQVCRVSVWGTLIGVMIFGGIMAAIAMAIEREVLPPFFWTSVIVIGLLMPFFMGRFWASLRKSNWLLWCGPEALHVQFRSMENHHFDRDTLAVAVIPYREIERAIGHVHERERQRSETTWKWREETLVLTLTVSTDALRQAVEEERERMGKRLFGSSRANSDPVTVDSEGAVLVHIRARQLVFGPGVHTVVQWLEKKGVNIAT